MKKIYVDEKTGCVVAEGLTTVNFYGYKFALVGDGYAVMVGDVADEDGDVPLYEVNSGNFKYNGKWAKTSGLRKCEQCLHLKPNLQEHVGHWFCKKCSYEIFGY